jgi:uridine monophosphate synthetase
MILKRKEIKGYGTKNILEGQYNKNDGCLIIEDVCTTGASIIETKVCLEETGLRCQHAIVVLDRDQGGVDNVARYKSKLHSVLKSMEVLDVLLNKGKITQTQYEESKNFLSRKDLIFEAPSKDANNNRVKNNELTYESRAQLSKNQIAKELFIIMAEKQTNLCVAADVTETSQLLQV